MRPALAAPPALRRHAALGLVLFATALFAVLTELQVGWIAGPPFWQWGLRKLAAVRVYPVLLAAALPFALAQWCALRRRYLAGVLLLMLAVLSLELTALGIGQQPFGLDRLAEFIRRPLYTSYFKDADTFDAARPWLSDYPERLATFRVHSRNKPPGPILFFVAVKRLAGNPGGPEGAAWLGGFTIALLSTLCVPATWRLVRGLTAGSDNPEAAFAGASYLALTPGLLLFLPCLDQVYPVFTALLVLPWHAALRRDSPAAAAGFGLALAATLFVTYNLLVLGLFLGLLTLDHLRRDLRGRLPGVTAKAAIALATTTAAYGLLWIATGYDPVRSFRAALANQAELAELWQRPWPITIPWDLADFLLGAGWLGGLLTVFYLLRARAQETERWRLALFVVVQIVGVALTGLLRTETARVWLFLQPLLAIPVGLELARWSPGRRQIVYFCLWVLTATICRNLRFL